MNEKMLKCLVEMANGKVSCIDTTKFFMQFPKTQANLKDLRYFNSLQYINILDGGGNIQEIGVNKSALDHFK